MYVSLESLSRVNGVVRLDLQKLHDTYFNWLLYSTAAVFIGVLLEGPEVVKDLVEEWSEVIHAPRIEFNALSGMPVAKARSRVPWKFVATIGWILVFAGVVGEGVFEGFMTKADALAEDFNNVLLEDAQGSATRANDLSLQLGLSLESERQNTARAQKEGADLQENLEKEAAALRKRAEDEATARVQLEEEIAPRRINVPDRIGIGDDLRDISDWMHILRMSFSINSYVGDLEAAVFAAQIRDSLLRADFPKPIDNIGRIPVPESIALARSGLLIRSNLFPSGRQPEAFATIFALMLNDEFSRHHVPRVRAVWEIDTKLGNMLIEIFVGVKTIEPGTEMLLLNSSDTPFPPVVRPPKPRFGPIPLPKQ